MLLCVWACVVFHVSTRPYMRVCAFVCVCSSGLWFTDFTHYLFSFYLCLVFSWLRSCSLSLLYTHIHFQKHCRLFSVCQSFLVLDMSAIFCCIQASLLPLLCVNHVEKTSNSGHQHMLSFRCWYGGVPIGRNTDI